MLEIRRQEMCEKVCAIQDAGVHGTQRRGFAGLGMRHTAVGCQQCVIQLRNA